MVLKHSPLTAFQIVVFESSVILDGTQTIVISKNFVKPFESSVILDGTQIESIADTAYR